MPDINESLAPGLPFVSTLQIKTKNSTQFIPHQYSTLCQYFLSIPDVSASQISPHAPGDINVGASLYSDQSNYCGPMCQQTINNPSARNSPSLNSSHFPRSQITQTCRQLVEVLIISQHCFCLQCKLTQLRVFSFSRQFLILNLKTVIVFFVAEVIWHLPSLVRARLGTGALYWPSLNDDIYVR